MRSKNSSYTRILTELQSLRDLLVFLQASRSSPSWTLSFSYFILECSLWDKNQYIFIIQLQAYTQGQNRNTALIMCFVWLFIVCKIQTQAESLSYSIYFSTSIWGQKMPASLLIQLAMFLNTTSFISQLSDISSVSDTLQIWGVCLNLITEEGSCDLAPQNFLQFRIWCCVNMVRSFSCSFVRETTKYALFLQFLHQFAHSRVTDSTALFWKWMVQNYYIFQSLATIPSTIVLQYEICFQFSSSKSSRMTSRSVVRVLQLMGLAPMVSTTFCLPYWKSISFMFLMSMFFSSLSFQSILAAIILSLRLSTRFLVRPLLALQLSQYRGSSLKMVATEFTLCRQWLEITGFTQSLMYFWSSPMIWLRYYKPLAAGLCGYGSTLFRIPRMESSLMEDSTPNWRCFCRLENRDMAVTCDSPYFTIEFIAFLSSSILQVSEAKDYSEPLPQLPLLKNTSARLILNCRCVSQISPMSMGSLPQNSIIFRSMYWEFREFTLGIQLLSSAWAIFMNSGSNLPTRVMFRLGTSSFQSWQASRKDYTLEPEMVTWKVSRRCRPIFLGQWGHVHVEQAHYAQRYDGTSHQVEVVYNLHAGLLIIIKLPIRQPCQQQMNKQLERELQSCIQSLKTAQLQNVLGHYEMITGCTCQKTVTRKAMNYECEVVFREQATRGFGRSQEQSVTNAIKNLFSMLVGRNMDTDKILQSLKYKNGVEGLSSMKKQPQNKDNSLMLDDISMIQPVDSRIKGGNGPDLAQGNACTCIYYESQQYHKNEIKHLQARVHLLSEENMLLKKMLMCGTPSKQPAFSAIDKQNDPYQANSLPTSSDAKNRQILH